MVEDEEETSKALKDYDGTLGLEEEEEDIEVGEVEEEKSLMDWVKTPTGDGEIEDYQDHVFNIDGSKGTSQIIRGATGFLGELNLAIADVVVGVFRLFKRYLWTESEEEAVEETTEEMM